MLIKRKTSVIPEIIKDSFQIPATPIPFIITDFTIMIYHLAGIMLESTCKIAGMLAIGKAYPLNITTGSIRPSREMSIAANCEFVMVDMKSPSESAQRIYKIVTAINKKMLP